MRSDLIFGALTHVTNRYKLCQLASKATRRLHKPNTRIEDTANEVFHRFARANPLAGVPSNSDLQLFPRPTRSENHSSYEDLEQSVA